MNVEVNRSACRGHGQCALIAPGVFQLDAADRARVLTPVVPPESEEAVEDAVVMCPEAAITTSG